jgi:hypothetical protein
VIDWPGGQQWYEIAEAPVLRQGDILRDLLVYWLPQTLPVPENDPPDGNINVSAAWDRGTWIVMSASCDVERPSRVYEQVLIGRVLEATKEALREPNDEALRTRLEVLRQGYPSAFVLAPHQAFAPPFPLSIVDWKTHLTMPADYIRSVVGTRPRLRLRSPFRESFGNWVGGNIQRVGIETDLQIPRFRAIFPEHRLRAEPAE